jgi:hypothetical protein
MNYYDFNTRSILTEELISTIYGSHILQVHNSIKSIEITSGGDGYKTTIEPDSQIFQFYVIITGGVPTQNAEAIVDINTVGSLVDLKIIQSGAGYEIGDILSISGVDVSESQTSAAILTVTSLNSVDDQLRLKNIYPIIEHKTIPDGWKENPIASIEELINEGPIYTHDDINAWRLCRLYCHES